VYRITLHNIKPVSCNPNPVTSTGKQLAVMDGTELILWRTACTSALAADYLARKNAKVMLMVGAGALAPHLIKAHLAIRPSLNKVLIYNRTHASAVKLVERLKGSEPLCIEAVTDLEAAVRASDVISCATLSCEALVLGAWLSPGAHLDLVGSFTPSMRECDDVCVKRARVVVDSSQAIESSGDLAQPLEQKAIETLAELAQGNVMGRASEDEITLFKSVGCTVGDLAAAQVVYEASMSA
jgi:alanine dehydrogenase